MKDTIKRKLVWLTFNETGQVCSSSLTEPYEQTDMYGYTWIAMYSRPQALYIDSKTPRSDGRKGKPTGVTINEIYDVLAENYKFYTIVNDEGNVCRYSKTRFKLLKSV